MSAYVLKLGAKKKIKIVIDGTEHLARVPSCEESEKFQEELEALTTKVGVKSKELMDMMRKYLADLGISEEVTKQLDTVDFQELIGFVNNPKKN